MSLYSFCDDAQIKSTAQRNECLYDGPRLAAFEHPRDESAINFDFVEWKLPELAQAGISDTKIIQRNLNSKRTYTIEHRARQFRILNEDAFGDF